MFYLVSWINIFKFNTGGLYDKSIVYCRFIFINLINKLTDIFLMFYLVSWINVFKFNTGGLFNKTLNVEVVSTNNKKSRSSK